MLKKLYIYDSKNLFKILLPFVFSLLGAGILCCGLFLLASLAPEGFSVLLVIPCVFLLFAIFIGGAVGMLYPYLYYFRSFYTDMAYFTFSFPASAKTQFHSKILSGATYMYAIALSTILSVAFALAGLFFGFIPDASLGIGEIFKALFGAMGSLDIVTSVLFLAYLIISPVISLLLAYTAINLGALTLKKHKVLGAILFYFITSWAVSFVEMVVSLVFSIAFISLSLSLNTFLSYLIQILLGVGIAIGAYFLSRHFLTKKFNLE